MIFVRPTAFLPDPFVVAVSRTIVLRPGTLKIPWCSYTVYCSGSVEVAIDDLLRCDSGDDGGVSVGRMYLSFGVAVRAINLNSIEFSCLIGRFNLHNFSNFSCSSQLSELSS